MYRLPDAPLPLSGILDDGFKLFRASWKQLLPVAVVASLLGAVVQLIILGSWQFNPGDLLALPTISLRAALTSLVFTMLTLVSYAIVLAGTHQAARSEPVSIGAAWREGLSRSPALLGVVILGALAISIGLLLLFVPGIYLMIVVYPAFLLPVVERLGPVASFSRALSLVKGSWWRTAGLLTVASLIPIALMLAISVVVEIVAIPFGGLQPLAQVSMGATLAIALLTAPLLPLVFCLIYAVYTDLRLRRDGRDLVARAAAAGM